LAKFKLIHCWLILDNFFSDLTEIPIDKTTGDVTPSSVAMAIQTNTILATIMMANNETGTIMV